MADFSVAVAQVGHWRARPGVYSNDRTLEATIHLLGIPDCPAVAELHVTVACTSLAHSRQWHRHDR